VRIRRQRDDGLAVRRVLVATDRSETAERAVRFAAEMAQRYDAELVLLRVLLSDEGTLGATGRELAEHAREIAGDSGRSAVVVADDPAEAIVAAAQREEADVIVVGSVGMTGRKEFLLHNVPNRVSHNAPCTVVIVQTNQGAS
jgi:nucleotide-binding universal stress UspA family protein